MALASGLAVFGLLRVVMRLVNSLNGWETYSYVAQDEEGTIITTGGGLYTKSLMNCLCVVATDGQRKYGMIHVNPNHKKQVSWVRSLIANTAAVEILFTGANWPDQDERGEILKAMLVGYDGVVVDETNGRWVQNSLAGTVEVTPGSFLGRVGWVAVNATTGEYAFAGAMGFPKTANLRNSRAQTGGRRSSDGCCSIQ